MMSYGTSSSQKAVSSSRRAPYVIVASVAGLATACVLLMAGVFKPAGPTELYQPEGFQRQSLANSEQLQAASYIDKWSHLASPDFQSPMEILAANKAGIPVIYPMSVVDKSGKLQKMVPAPMLRAIQKPLFNMVPQSQSSMLACICETCDPFAGFPPVCTGCTCEEAEMNDKVWFLGHTRACGDDECDDIREGGDDAAEEGEEGDADADADAAEAEEGAEEGAEEEEGGEKEAPEAKNALLDFPECDTWSCYNKDGWFCACVCPGSGC
eukprot:CAMPEP_0181347738 /NCGR_PEP_ID=MMETSP1101-20121128/34037_1 /TAXON_ID=46948 /ORGANISM="Rhodomonas abbreviata, Strain Caron Lab Isolate" /LENGTH=267 /DNA_ID=CAMNT_0023459969 /DNA_START=78 /DNA_END=881 /DNA_ORIENTATION=+